MNQKKYLIYFVALTVMVSFLRCNIYTDISVTSDVNTDFTQYHTFAWLPDNADTAISPYNNEIIRNNIRNYFGHSFSERGYTLDLDTPDILLQIVISNKRKVREVGYFAYPRSYYYSRYYYGSEFYYPYPFSYYYNPYNAYCYPYGYCTEKIEYVEGAIVLNVIDRKQNKLVWSGTAKGDIYDPVYINKNIHPAVQAIMKKYPVKTIINQKYKGREKVLTNATD